MSKSRSGAPRRVAAGLLAGALTVVGLALAAPAGAADSVTNDRVAGADRFGTAAAACTEAYEAGTETVIIATARDFPDALAASGLAGSNDGCILLTEVDQLPEASVAAIQDLGASNAIIVGGTAAVSQDVEDFLNDEVGVTTTRVAGDDRFETAAEIASAIGTAGELEGEGPTAILASGRSSADALAAGPIAAAGDGTNQVPILLTEQNDLPAATLAAIDELGITNIIVVGGTGVISEAVRNEAGAAAGDDSVTVLAGTDRNKTAVAIAEFAVTELGWGPETVCLANSRKPAGADGVDFGPDALSGGPLCGLRQAPILLVVSDGELGADTEGFLDDHSDTITELLILGGTAAINDIAEEAAVAAAENTENDEATAGDSATSGIDGPELQSCSVSGLDLDDLIIIYAYTFDEDLDEDSVDEAMFKLYDHYNVEATEGDDAGEDADVDGDTVHITYSLFGENVASATLCAVADGAVEDEDGNTNPPQSLTVGGDVEGNGITPGPDLVSAEVTEDDNTDALNDDFEVTYTFDQVVAPELTDFGLADAITDSGYQIVLRSGFTVSASSCETTPEDDEASEDVVCTFDEEDITAAGGDGEDIGDAVRAVVLANSNMFLGVAGGNPTMAANLTSSGNSEAPDLVSVTTDADDDTVTFIFDDDIDSTGAGPAASGFHLYNYDCEEMGPLGSNCMTAGGVVGGASVLEVDEDEVTVQFPANAVNAFNAGAYVDEGTVTDDDDDGDADTSETNGPDEVGLDVEFDAGDVAGPQLTGAEITVDSNVSGFFQKFEVTFTFTQNVDEDELTDGAFAVWFNDEDGNSDRFDLDVADCEADDNEVVCEETDEDSDLANATVASVDFGAVITVGSISVDDDEISVQVENPEGSFAVTVPDFEVDPDA